MKQISHHPFPTISLGYVFVLLFFFDVLNNSTIIRQTKCFRDPNPRLPLSPGMQSGNARGPNCEEAVEEKPLGIQLVRHGVTIAMDRDQLLNQNASSMVHHTWSNKHSHDIALGQETSTYFNRINRDSWNEKDLGHDTVPRSGGAHHDEASISGSFFGAPARQT